MDTDIRFPGSLLVDLYLRLRDEVDDGRLSLDPNHKIRSSIVMAIFSAAETSTDVISLEAHVRSLLGQPSRPQTLAA
jgi:hypothetical protein